MQTLQDPPVSSSEVSFNHNIIALIIILNAWIHGGTVPLPWQEIDCCCCGFLAWKTWGWQRPMHTARGQPCKNTPPILRTWAVTITCNFPSGGQISTKHLKTSIRPFFATCRLPQYPEFAKNLRSFDGFDQMSAFWSMFWFNPLPYGIWSAVHDMARGPTGHPCEDDIRESKDDSGGCFHSCHAL